MPDPLLILSVRSEEGDALTFPTTTVTFLFSVMIIYVMLRQKFLYLQLKIHIYRLLTVSRRY